MKSKKLWAMVLVFALLFPNVALHSSTEESEQPGTAEIAGTNRTIDYWQNVIATGDNDAIYSVETTDTLGTTNESDVSDRRITDTPPENIIYVQVDNFDELSNSYYDFNYDWISEGGYVVNPTATEVPSPEPTATSTPIPSPTATSTPIPSPTATSTPIPSPTATSTPIPSPTATSTPIPSPTATSTPIPSPTATSSPIPSPTATSTPIPSPTATSTPIPSPTATPTPRPLVVKPNSEGKVYVIPEEKTPQKISYNIDLEVGRLAHIKPQKTMNHSKTSSDTSIINDPRSAVGSFDVEYEARANNPGDATLTFYNQNDLFTEEWNVHVFCRPLDFEKTEYVVEKTEGKDAYITLFLKYFEYSFEYAYAFEWESSDTSVAYLAGADHMSTYCRLCVKKPGVTIITVKDKYGNSSQCALIVKDAEKAKPTPNPVNKLGDINGDNTIDAKDVTVLRRYLAGGWNVTINEQNADLNNDAKVDAKDVTILRRYLAGGWGIVLGQTQE